MVAAAVIGGIATVGSAAVASSASRSASRDAASASREATEAASQATDRQQDLAERQYNDYLTDLRPRQFAEMDRAIESSRVSEERAGRQFDFEYGNSQRYSERYWNRQAPLEDGLIDDAEAFDTVAEQDRQGGLANADVRGRYADMRTMMGRDNARRGVNPGSAAAQALAMQAAQEEALVGASADTSARFNAQQLGVSRRMDVAALGRGLPGFSSSSSGLAGGFNNQGLNAGGAGLAAVDTSSGISNNAATTGSNLWGASADTATQGFNAFDRARNTAFRDPRQAAYGAIAGGLQSYGFNQMGMGGP